MKKDRLPRKRKKALKKRRLTYGRKVARWIANVDPRENLLRWQEAAKRYAIGTQDIEEYRRLLGRLKP